MDLAGVIHSRLKFVKCSKKDALFPIFFLFENVNIFFFGVLTSVTVVVVDGLLPDPVVCAGDGKLTAEGGCSRNVRVVHHSVNDNVEKADKVAGH